MAERQGFQAGFGRRQEGDRPGGGARRGPRRPQRVAADDLAEWVPVSKLGRLVKEGRITSLEQIYLHSLPIKEYQIVDFFYEGKASPADIARGRTSGLMDEVMKIMPVQKQTSAGQRTRFKAFVAVGDNDGHVGLGVKCAKEVATAIRGAIIAAKMSLIPVRRGYWGNKIGLPHTVPMKVSGKCGSVTVRLIPAPRGSHIVGAPTTKKMLGFAGLKDAFTCTTGCSKTRGNFMKALFAALKRTYGYLTPDLWVERELPVSPFQAFSDLLAVPPTKKIADKDLEVAA